MKLRRAEEPKVSLFLSGLPLWAALILVVVLPTLVVMGGLVVSHRAIQTEHLGINNELAGFKFATVGAIYSVLLAFAVIVVWEKFNDAETAVVDEAGAAATIYRLAAGTDPGTVAMRAALGNYLKLAIDQDWPEMAQRSESHNATLALDTLYRSAVDLAQDKTRQPAVIGEIFTQLDSITKARRTRLHLAAGIVPGIVWLVLSAGAVLTVGFTFFFGTRNLAAQVMMSGVLSALVFIGLLVIVSLSHPFTGPAAVDSKVLQRVAEDFGG